MLYFPKKESHSVEAVAARRKDNRIPSRLFFSTRRGQFRRDRAVSFSGGRRTLFSALISTRSLRLPNFQRRSSVPRAKRPAGARAAGECAAQATPAAPPAGRPPLLGGFAPDKRSISALARALIRPVGCELLVPGMLILRGAGAVLRGELARRRGAASSRDTEGSRGAFRARPRARKCLTDSNRCLFKRNTNTRLSEAGTKARGARINNLRNAFMPPRTKRPRALSAVGPPVFRHRRARVCASAKIGAVI